MELVCKESRRPFAWFCDDGIYIRKDNKNCENDRIRGQNLPDPVHILEARKAAIAKGQLPLGSRIEADPVTKQLWEHYHADFNN